MKQIIFFIVSTFLLLSCNGTVTDKEISLYGDGIVTLDVPILKQVATDLPSVAILFDSIVIIPLQTTSYDSYLGNIDDIKSLDDTLIIKSGHSLFFFQKNGSFIRKIEKHGRGRGEYLSISRFDIDIANRKIVVLDKDLKKVLRYSLNGEYESEIEISDIIYDFAILPCGDYLFFNPDGYGDQSRFRRGLWRTSINGEYKGHLVTIGNEFRHVAINDHYMTHINDTLIGLQGIEDKNLFYHITNDTIIPVYYMTTDIVIPKKLKKTDGNWGNPKKEYVKLNYLESNSLFSFSLTNFKTDVRVFYDKNTGEQYHLLLDDVKRITTGDQFIPMFISSYQNEFYTYVTASQILNSTEFKDKYPNLKENSNPIIVIYRTK